MSQPQHLWCGFYPPVAPGGFHAPWMASSAPYHIPPYHLPTSKRAPWSSNLVCDETSKEQIRLRRDYVAQRTTVPMRQTASYPYAKFWTSFKGLLPGSKRGGGSRLDVPPLPLVTRNQRKADGHFAHSVANRTQVRNPTFRGASSVTLDRNDPPKSLRRTDDNARRRVGSQPGGTQAALHPRSYDWSWPQFPTAQYIRLHPYLQHRCNGPPPIAFDIARGLSTLQPTRSSATTTSLDPTQLAQPATHPPVQRMHIRSVSEDPLPHVPWPIEVENARGITCGDVLDAIARAFFECVGQGEFRSWTRYRQGVAARAYYQRVGSPVDSGPHSNVNPDTYANANLNVNSISKLNVDRDSDPNLMRPSRARHDMHEGLRRIDYMGDRVLFHGLEQASALVEDTWFMYVAVSERSKL